MTPLSGPALVFGDEVNTDELHPSAFYSLDDRKVRDGFLRYVDGHEQTGERDLTGSIVMAGHTFGIGSSRETGAKVFVLAGVRAVVAVSFARIFRRNLLNLGLPAIECPALTTLGPIGPGTPVILDIVAGTVTVGERVLSTEPLDPYWREVLAAGGLLEHLGLGAASR